jgi:hypothetical protein
MADNKHSFPRTYSEAMAMVRAVAVCGYSEYHNDIISSSEYGPERFVALAAARAHEVAMWSAIAQALAAGEGDPGPRGHVVEAAKEALRHMDQGLHQSARVILERIVAPERGRALREANLRAADQVDAAT